MPQGAKGKSSVDADRLEEVLSGLTRSFDRLADSVEQIGGRLLERMDGQPTSGLLGPPPTDPAQRLALHIRRYTPLYALAAVIALILVLFPTVDRENRPVTQVAGGGAGSDVSSSDVGSGLSVDQQALSPDAGVRGTGTTAAGAPRTARNAVTGAVSTQPIGQVKAGVGVTRGGFECKPGVNQLPWSQYAAPCLAKFEGSNGGNTFRGVTADKITIVRRITEGGTNTSAITTEYQRQAGLASADEQLALLKKWLEYMNKTYELYGRKVEIVDFHSKADGTQEATGGGQEQACADAAEIAQTYKAFAVLSAGFVFMNCAVKEKIFVPKAANYWPEKDLKRWHPFGWERIMECERLSYHIGESLGKRVMGRKAIRAGEALLRAKDRKLGWHVPDDDSLGYCVNIMRKEVQRHCSCDPGPEVRYPIDLTRMPDAAARAMVQFQAEGVTTIMLGTINLIIQVMSNQAKQQDYWPEWWLPSVLGTDLDGSGQTYEQDEVHGRMWGISQAGSDAKIFSKEGELARSYKAATGQDLKYGLDGFYFDVIHIYNLFQAAGPILTPDNIAAGMKVFPIRGGELGADGTWIFNDGNHTAHADMREIYYDRNVVSPSNGKPGSFIEINGGKRYLIGQHPSGEFPMPNMPGVKNKSAGG